MRMVRPYSAIILPGVKPITNPEMIAAMSMPVPVKDSQVKENTAPSGVGRGATGATLLIMLWRSGTGKFHVAHGLTVALNQPVPQIRSTAQTMIHGTSEAHTSALVGSVVLAAGRGGAVSAEMSCVRSFGDSHSSAGCHTFRKPIRQAIEMSEAPTSTIQGLM